MKPFLLLGETTGSSVSPAVPFSKLENNSENQSSSALLSYYSMIGWKLIIVFFLLSAKVAQAMINSNEVITYDFNNSTLVIESAINDVNDNLNRYYNIDDLESLATLKGVASGFLYDHKLINRSTLKQLFQFQSRDSLLLVKDRLDVHGSRLMEYHQKRDAIEIYQSSIKILYDVNGRLVSISGSWYTDYDEGLTHASTSIDIETIVFKEKSKSDLLMNHLDKLGSFVTPKVDVIPIYKKVFKITDTGLKPFWTVDLYFYNQNDITVLIDDNSRIITEEILLVNSCDHSTVSTPHNGARNFKSSFISGKYVSVDNCDSYNIIGLNNFGNNNDDLSSADFYKSSNTSFSSSYEIIGAVSVWGMSEFNDLLVNRFSRNSYDSNGGNWISVNNTLVGGSANNASFRSSTGIFSFGRGSSSSSLLDDYNTIDIIGHEVSHGIDFHESNLIYQYESGAIDESFADIWGSILEWYILSSTDWVIGGDIGASRSLSNPHDYNDPSTYLGTHWYSGSGDSGGVHTNSGVQNFFFYLLVEGGSGNNDGNSYNQNGIGMDKGINLAYKVLTDLVSSNTDYNSVRNLWLSAASALYPNDTNVYNAVRDAWCACGIGGSDCNIAPLTNDNPCDAINLNVNNSCSLITQNVNGATASNFNDPTCDDPVTIDVWYKFLVPSSGMVNLRTFDVDLTNGTPDFGAQFYSSCSTSANTIACVQNSFSINSSSYMPGADNIDLSGYENTEIYLRLFDHGSSVPGGSFEICLFENSGSSSTCDEPHSLGANNIQSDSANIFWQANNVNCVIDGFDLRLYIGSDTSGTSVDSWNDYQGTSMTLTGLLSNTTYTYRVRHDCDCGGLGRSNYVTYTFTTPSSSSPTCDEPHSLGANNIQSDSATIFWQANSVNCIIDGFDLRLYIGSDTSGTSVDSWNDYQGTSIPLTGLLPNTTYTFRVRHDCDCGGLGRSNYVTYTFTTSSTLSNPDLDLGKVFQIYPNPTSDIVNIMSNESGYVLSKIELYDLRGIRLEVKENDLTSISLKKLSAGTYFLRIYDSENRSTYFKIIKR